MQYPAPATTASTEVPAEPKAGFPPFKTETFPSQVFWLAVTFAFLFVVMWRIAGPRIGGAIAARKARLEGDLSAAEFLKKDAEAASNAYDAALSAARGRAHALAEENRKRVQTEIDAAKQRAEAEASQATAQAEASIAASRKEALSNVGKAAQDAAIAIVSRLTGDSVTSEEAAAAVRAVTGA